MARKSLANMVIESNMNNFASTSSPLRRRTMVSSKPWSPLLENDDEAERLALRRNATTSTPNFNKSNERRHSLGLGSLAQMPEPKMTELISQCIKLSTENKINLKNAFSLEMIDFMTFMVTKRNSELTNLQMASTSLDVCTKIYGYRVDGIYIEILKMVGALDKQKEDLTDVELDEANNLKGEELEVEHQTKKKKKKGKQKVICTEDAINGSIEIMLPSQMGIGKGDLCSSDMLYQVALPYLANTGFYYNTCNDIVLDQLNETNTNNENIPTYTISKIEDISQLDLCPCLSSFEFLRWSLEDEEEIIESVQDNLPNRFQFDLDASINSIEEDEGFRHEDYFEMEKSTTNKDMCVGKTQRTENIVDFRKIMIEQMTGDQKMPEYSFLLKNLNSNHWAGPYYWKNKALNTFLTKSNVVETCKQAAIKKKKEIEITYTDKDKSELDEKFLNSKVSKIKVRTARKNWKEEKITLPEDIHYDNTQLRKLYLCPFIFSCRESEGLSNTTQLPENIEIYDYNNDNDVSNFCPGIDVDSDVQDRNDLDELRNEDGNIMEIQEAFTNDNLVAAPTLTNKIFMNYPLRAKKIDMRQLKSKIWEVITKHQNPDNNEKEQQSSNQIKESVNFSDIYKTLPNELSKVNVESLSVPIALVSLLHLANEKSLTLSSLPDSSDITIASE
ncbi:hypothetical protein M0802_010575 [Mischocyttarus mexicanus]|nr:hypothetical protein M0802_010575 [Mischocyttarus mexicanus]